MATYVDTSALYALLDTDNRQHQSARLAWDRLEGTREHLITSNYMLVEATALILRRLGLQALRNFQGNFLPLLTVHWVDEPLHDRAMSALLTAGLRDLSLVDCVGFELMRQLEIDSAFVFDAHFARQGFTCIPAPIGSSTP